MIVVMEKDAAPSRAKSQGALAGTGFSVHLSQGGAHDRVGP